MSKSTKDKIQDMVETTRAGAGTFNIKGRYSYLLDQTTELSIMSSFGRQESMGWGMKRILTDAVYDTQN